MLIERLITYIARKKNARYLQFSPATTLPVSLMGQERSTLLYVHIPFCEELCPYCSFNRVVFREDVARPYFKALRQEVLMYKDLGYDFQGLYVGGGTPTVLIDELASTLHLIKQTYRIKEVSVETNPNHLGEGNLRILRDAGVMRLSVGVQTFDDGLLKAIERHHKYGSGKEIAERLGAAQGIFETLNVDMIFNFPTQTLEILERDLATLLSLRVDQVTYYPLMVSSSTQQAMTTRLGVIDYDRGRAFYEKITGMLSPHYRATTAWCFSRTEAPIDEYVVNYDEYAGLGSGSIGYLGGSAYANTFDIGDYIGRINRGALPIAAKKTFSVKEMLQYDFLMKLFGMELNLDLLSTKHCVRAHWYLLSEIFFFWLIGGLRKEGRLLRLTEKGQYYWVLMMREFFIGVNNFRDYCRAEFLRKS
jgi:coproporphyrinogen III oxidase-like Fe-S oxidoreductase